MLISKKLAGISLRSPRALFFAVFAVSGFSGLIYESIWSHYLKLFLGHAAYAQSLVLAIFMGGMGIGSWLASKYSSRWAAPLLVYALVEAIVGVAALGFHGGFTGLIDWIYHSALPASESIVAGNAIKWTAATLLILPQSILLGMTFPLMSAGVLRRFPKQPGSTLAMLYFSNSIGAAIGVLASGFWLIGLVGLPGTIRIAGLMNLALAAFVSLVAVGGLRDRRPAPESVQPVGGVGVGRLFLLAAFVTGAASFIYEVAWLRMLSLVLGATTHSFELMLSAFIAGLAFGGLWIRKHIDRIESPVRFAAFVQIFMGLFAFATLPVYVASFGWMGELVDALGKTDTGYALFTLFRSGIALAVMLPATFLAGMTLPLFTFVLMNDGAGEKAIGRVYSANTFGAIAGVVFAVHVGMPVLGLKNLVATGALLDIVLGLVMLYTLKDKVNYRHLLVALTAVAVAVSINNAVRFDNAVLSAGVYRHGSLASAASAEVIYYQDGKTATIAVTEWPDLTRMISTNGKSDAALKEFPDFRPTQDAVTMVMAGSAPLAFHPEARSIANIGMGSGLTTHVLLSSEQIERVDTIEIEPAMVMGARGFGYRVRRAFNDPRSEIHIEDAKSFFSLRNSQYDIIVAEPSNPWVSGVASLFSSEFYQSVRQFIAPQGLFVQWLQLYEFNDELVVTVLKALDTSFSDYAIYATDSSNILVIASPDGPLRKPDFDSLFVGSLQEELNFSGLYSKHDFLVRRLADRSLIRHLLRDSEVPANSDYFPFLDFNAGRARYLGSRAEIFLGWSLSQLPMLEMLGDARELDLSMVFPDNTFAREQRVTRAMRAARSVMRQSAPAHDPVGVDYNTARTIATLNLGAADCFAQMPAGLWLLSLHDLATQTLAFVPPQKAQQMLDTLLDSSCADGQTVAFRDRFALYRAVARRDGTAMKRVAKRLLPTMTQSSAPERDYVVTAGMLGAVAVADMPAALALWREYAGEQAPEQRPAAHDLNLLRSMALAGRPDALASRLP